MSERTLDDLRMKQALPLDVKISLTRERIRQWVHEYGEDGVYVSFSGGKDSTVLLDIVRNVCDYKSIPAVFVDVPTQFPELREFATSFENVEVIKPKISFVEVCKKYGFPLISKEVAESVSGAKKYLKKLLTSIQNDATTLTDRQTDRRLPYKYYFERVTETGKYNKFSTTPSIDEMAIKQGSRGGYDRKYRRLRGIGEFAKPQDAQSRRGQQQKVSGDVGMVYKKQSKTDSGEYP